MLISPKESTNHGRFNVLKLKYKVSEGVCVCVCVCVRCG